MTVKARLIEENVRCGTKNCGGRFGQLVGDLLNPGPGWQYHEGEHTPTLEVDTALTGGTWRPTKRARQEWRRAYELVRRMRATEDEKRAVREGLSAFARSEPRAGIDEEGGPVFSRRRLIGESAMLPLRVECYACGAENEVTR